MTIAMSELVDAEPCDVLRGGEGPVYFLFGGRLYVVHEVLGRWIEPVADPKPRPASAKTPELADEIQGADPDRAQSSREATKETGELGSKAKEATTPPATPRKRRGKAQEPGPDEVEHWLVVASVGRFGTPGVFRLQRRPTLPAGPDVWSVRAERRDERR